MAHADTTMQFIGTDAIFAVGDEPHCNEPFVQAKRSVFKNCANLDAELPFTILTAIHVALIEARIVTGAMRADNAVRVGHLHGEMAGNVGIGDVVDDFD